MSNREKKLFPFANLQKKVRSFHFACKFLNKTAHFLLNEIKREMDKLN